MNFGKKANNDYSPLNNKTNNSLTGVNKKLVYERRIGSGRLVPRDVNWEMRGAKKQIEKDNNTGSQNHILEKDKDASTSGEEDKITNSNSSSIRYSDGLERRVFDRRIANAHESNNVVGSSNNKRYTSSTLEDERNTIETNYHQQPNFTGQRSMSFRRREYIDHRDNHREFRDFRDQKESRELLNHRESRGGEQCHTHKKDEPEWFSEGPTSQHDTIELRGFEESDESNHHIINKYSKTERKNSEGSLLSHNSSNNNNLSTTESTDALIETSNNPSINKTTTNMSTNDHCNNIINTKQTTATDEDALKESSDNAEFVSDFDKNLSKTKRFNEDNVTDLFFDNFLNIEELENSLIGNVNDQATSNIDLNFGGTSRFSRWFFNNSNNPKNSDEYNNNPPTKDDSHLLSKGLSKHIIPQNLFHNIFILSECHIYSKYYIIAKYTIQTKSLILIRFDSYSKELI